MDGRISHDGAKGRNARSNTGFKYCFTGHTGNCGGEEHSINAGAIALFWLQNPQPAAQKRILSQRLGHG
jgi:hypothetical protein